MIAGSTTATWASSTMGSFAHALHPLCGFGTLPLSHYGPTLHPSVITETFRCIAFQCRTTDVCSNPFNVRFVITCRIPIISESVLSLDINSVPLGKSTLLSKALNAILNLRYATVSESGKNTMIRVLCVVESCNRDEESRQLFDRVKCLYSQSNVRKDIRMCVIALDVSVISRSITSTIGAGVMSFVTRVHHKMNAVRA